MEAGGSTNLFEVTDQQQAQVLRPDGTLGVQWTVYLTAGNGVKGYITIPGEDYTPANVHAQATDWAEKVMGVAALNGSNPPSQ